VTFVEEAGSKLFVSQIAHFSNELGLSEEQAGELRSLIEERVLDLRPIVADLVVARSTTIAQLLRPHGKFERVIREIIQEKGEARLKDILSPEQFRKLRKMRASTSL
jgi:hypothetical protein